MTKCFYMHTINGAPGQYCPRSGYIAFSPTINRLEKSLTAIKAQQARAKTNDAIDGVSFKYGYIRIKRSAVSETSP